MKFLPLLWANLKRKKLRTLLTIGSIVFAFVLFGILAAVDTAFSLGVDLTGADRLILIHKVSLIQPLPFAYKSRIEQVDGVSDLTYATWFGGIYKDPKNFFAQMAVDPESYLRLYPEFLLPEEQKEAWFADRTAVIAGRVTAELYGWKIGDRIPIQPTVWQRADGKGVWEFDLVGIYDGAEKGVDTTQFLFHYDYFNEARAFGQDQVGWYIIRIADPAAAVETAERIDKLFANSPAETKTTTEKAFVQGFADQIGNIGAIVRGIVFAVFFIILLTVGSTIVQSVRERTNELAVLKTVGFSNGRVLWLVLGESLFIAALGGAIGLALSWVVVGGMAEALARFLPALFIPPGGFAVGVGLIVVLGVAAGLLPAIGAMRLSIVEALRRTT